MTLLVSRDVACASAGVVTPLLSMALEDDPQEILLQNNDESIALDPWAFKNISGHPKRPAGRRE